MLQVSKTTLNSCSILLPLLLLSALQPCSLVQALSTHSSVLSGAIALKQSSVSLQCVNSAMHQCTVSLRFESNGSQVTLVPLAGSQALCGIGQGKILRSQASGHFVHNINEGLNSAFILKRAIAKGASSRDITCVQQAVWELELTIANDMEQCTGRYVVLSGDHLLGVTVNGTLSQPSPVVVSADDLKVVGFIATAIIFVLVQYALVHVPLKKQPKAMAESNELTEGLAEELADEFEP